MEIFLLNIKKLKLFIWSFVSIQINLTQWQEFQAISFRVKVEGAAKYTNSRNSE